MKFEERKAIIEKLNLWEQKYPVDKWMIEGIHLWPIIKKEFFFSLYKKGNSKDLQNKNHQSSILIKILNKLFRKPKAWLILKQFKINEAKILFSGAPSHRVDWNGKRFNRYFDPLLDYLENMGEGSYLLEYSNVILENVYKSSRVINLKKTLPFFVKKLNFKKAWGNLKCSPEFNCLLKELIEETNLTESALKKTILKSVQNISNWANLYEYFLLKSKAKYILGLCYYNNEMFGMNLAAKKLNVVSIDMQHGGQGDYHFAYHFNKIPTKGYNILPEKFWVWDNLSFDQIIKWNKDENHLPIIGGNPWIEFLTDDLKVQKKFNDSFRPMILFTLQPLKPIIDDYFLEVISLTCKKYSWWLRLHPRMAKEEVTGLNLKLVEFKLKGFVNIEDASNEPLPLLLKECRLHVSKYSGSIAEAALMQIPSLVIDEIGVKSFEDLIESKIAVACLSKNPAEINDLIEIILNKPEIQPENLTNVATGYKTIIDEFIKNN